MSAKDFYAALTGSHETYAKAARAEQASDFDAMRSIDRAFEDGFLNGMVHAYILLNGTEPDSDLFETSCDDLACDGECDSNYCDSRDGAFYERQKEDAKARRSSVDDDESPSFECPVCKQVRPFEDGSGDCQTCVACCKCNALPFGVYCMPYGASEQVNPESEA